MAYQHTQSGWPLRIALGVTALGLVVVSQLRPFAGHSGMVEVLVAAAFAAATALLCQMTIRLDAARLHWSFGLGWPRFSLPLDEIQGAEVTRTTFWQGWGVHRTRHGWLYNIAGFDAVLITRKDGKQFLLGTDEPHRLKVALDRRIAPRSRG